MNKREKHILVLRFNQNQTKKTIAQECLNVEKLEHWCIIDIRDIEAMSEKLYNICMNTQKRAKKDRLDYFVNQMKKIGITFDNEYQDLMQEEFNKGCFVSYGISPLDELYEFAPPY